MIADRGQAVLIVKTPPVTRRQLVSLLVLFAGMTGLCLILAVLFCIQEWPKGPAHAILAAAVGAGLLVLWPVLAVLCVRENPRGVWRLDGDGIAFEPNRGAGLAVRWKEVEQVKWGRQLALRTSQTTLRLPLNLIDEPGRSEVRSRLQAILGTDFDLTFRTMPDRLDAVEPAWWNLTLRILRVVVAGLVVSSAVLGSFYWVVLHHPERGAWQSRAVFFGWYCVLMGGLVYYHLTFRKLNPTWRRRLHKVPVDELGEPL